MNAIDAWGVRTGVSRANERRHNSTKDRSPARPPNKVREPEGGVLQAELRSMRGLPLTRKHLASSSGKSRDFPPVLGRLSDGTERENASCSSRDWRGFRAPPNLPRGLSTTMMRSFRPFLRPLASLALAVALAAPLALESNASAQLGQATPPTPVSAELFETMLKEAGLPDTVKDAALPLHEGYFARFREFEEREVKPALESSHGGAMMMGLSVDDAKKDAESSRRLLQRAAQLDGQLVDELIGVLTAADAVHAEALRNALTRRRCTGLSPSIGMGNKSLAFSLLTASPITGLDATARASVDPALDAYDTELTRLLERHAEAAITRGVRAAEIREEVGLANPPQFEEGGDEAAQGAGEEWFAKMRDVQQRAAEEGRTVALRMRRLHRDTLTSIEPLLPADSARALRAELARRVYPSIHVKGEFNSLVKTAQDKRAKGEIDDAVWSSVTALLDTHDLTARPLFDDAMTAADKVFAAQGDSDFIMWGESREGNPDQERVNEVREQLAALDGRDAATLRDLLGLGESAPQTAVSIGRGGEAFNGSIQLDGANLEGAITSVATAVMLGGDGEMIVLGGDDLGEGAFPFFSGGGDSSPRIARPLTGEELDALAAKTGFTDDARVVFDEIVATCTKARADAESEFGDSPQQITSGGDGEFTMTFTIAGGEAMPASDPDAPAKLAAAVDAAEETMFEELKAAAHSDKLEATDAARRARARVRGLTGERGAQVADLVLIVDAAHITPDAQALIQEELTTWDEGSLAVISTMRGEVKTLQAEREQLIEEATTTVTEDNGNGSTSMRRAVEIGGDIAEKMQKVEERLGKARTRVADLNTRTVASFEAKLEGEPAARQAIVRGFLRAANPSIYKMPRDLAPFFTRASTLEGVTAEGKVKIETLKAEWIESREAQCEAFIEARDAVKTESSDDPMSGMRAMQAQTRERKLLRESLEQNEASVFRRLKDLLVVEVGATKAAEVGELPAAKKRAMPQIQFGG